MTSPTLLPFSRLRLSLDELILFSEFFKIDDNFIKLVTVHDSNNGNDGEIDQTQGASQGHRVNTNRIGVNLERASVIHHTNQTEIWPAQPPQWRSDAPIAMEYERVRLWSHIPRDCLQVTRVCTGSICAAPIPVWQPTGPTLDQTYPKQVMTQINETSISTGERA